MKDFTKEIADNSQSTTIKLENGKYAPQHFFYGLMVAPSGGGKTNTLLNMIMGDDPDIKVRFDKIYIYAKDLDEDAYKYLLSKLDAVAEYLKDNCDVPSNFSLYEASSSLADVPKPDQLDQDKVNLMIFDDWVGDPGQNIIEQHYKFGRKHNCSYFYLSQDYYMTPKFVRRQVNFAMIWKLASETDRARVLKENVSGFDGRELAKIYDAATAAQYSFLVIDRKAKDKSMKLRCGLKGISRWADDVTPPPRPTRGRPVRQ